jgi:hypothetical protein
MNGMNRIGIERLCVFGMPPVEFVTLAADLGCSFVGIGLTPMRAGRRGATAAGVPPGPAASGDRQSRGPATLAFGSRRGTASKGRQMRRCDAHTVGARRLR